MKLFFNPWCASGARNFYGEGYWFSGKRLENTTLVTKTMTWEPRAGNMPLNGTQPKEYYPKCIKVNFSKCAILNAVGLSNPGTEALFATGRYQLMTKPFILSFTAVDATLEERINKLIRFVDLVKREKFNAPIALQLNMSCPNANCMSISEIQDVIDIARKLKIPLIPKVNALTNPKSFRYVKKIAAICISNTIPYGKGDIDWHGLFGEESPLAKYGGGGLSGTPIIPIIYDWLLHANLSVPIVTTAGQSILDLQLQRSAGASIFEIGTVNILRPWRVEGIIKYAK